MNSAPLLDVSVIVPVYNAEHTVRHCFDSLCEQTFDSNRMEIIAVDDCSTDGSGAICDEYDAKYDFFHAIHHEENSGGTCAPRNTGTNAAKGEYILFADADDWYGPEAFQRLYDHAKEWDSEYVLGKPVFVNRTDRRGWVAFARGDRPTFVDLNIRENLELCQTWGPWARLVKRSVIVDNDITFDPEILYQGDQVWNLEVLRVAKRPCIANDYEYYFLRRDKGVGSWTRAEASTPHKSPESVFRTLNKIVDLVESDEANLDPNNKVWLKLFNHNVRGALLNTDKAAQFDEERYPDRGQEFKDKIWERVEKYYSAPVRRKLALVHVCWYDAIAAGLGYDYEDTIKYYVGQKIKDGGTLERIEKHSAQAFDINENLHYLSQEALNRLLAVQACNYELFFDYENNSEGASLVEGDLWASLYITDDFTINMFVKDPANSDEFIQLDTFTYSPVPWGEDYQMRAKWQAALPEDVQFPLEQNSLKFSVSFRGETLYEAPVMPWDGERGKPQTIPAQYKIREKKLLAEKNALIAENKELNTELHEAKRTLKKVTDSRSWRYTRFIRSMLGHTEFD